MANKKPVKCKHCGSENTVKNGIIRYSGKEHQRYVCKDCNKLFMETRRTKKAEEEVQTSRTPP